MRAESADLGALSGPTFSARHPGTCSAAGDAIVPDDLIHADGEGGYAHPDCEETMVAVSTPVCPTCFQHRAINGACGCDA